MGHISSPKLPLETRSTPNYRGPMTMVTALFFIWGFLTVLNDILVPHLKAIFELNYAEVMLINSAFFGAYFVFSLPSGKLVEWIGYKATIVAGLFTMAAGALLFIPAADVPSFPLFLIALVVLGAGMTLLQVAANPYVTFLGPAKTASSRLNLTQAFNSLGTTIAPYAGSLVILSAATLSTVEMSRLSPSALTAYKLHEAASVKLPYLGFAAVLIALGLVFVFYRMPAFTETLRKAPGVEAAEEKFRVWQSPQLVLGALGIFLYVGAEVSIGSFLANYLNQPNIGNLNIQAAAGLVSFYWMGAMVGRFVGSAVLQKADPRKILGAAAIVALILVASSILSSGVTAMATILCVGLFNSIMFPNIFSLGIEGLGPLTSKGSGILIMACIGGAAVPVAEGILADHIGIQHAFILPVLCYIYIAYYGFRGSRLRHRALA